MAYRQILAFDGNNFFVSHQPHYPKDSTIQNTPGIDMIACEKCDIHYCSVKEIWHDGKLIKIPEHFTKCGCQNK